MMLMTSSKTKRMMTLTSLTSNRDPQQYSERLFEELVDRDPNELMRLIRSETLATYDLTFAAEILGRTATPEACEVLLELTCHESPLVREGAVLGLESMTGEPQVQARLAEIAQQDASAGVRTAAAEALDV